MTLAMPVRQDCLLRQAALNTCAREGGEQTGYIYVYLSNESDAAIPVYFDDLTIEHRESMLVQSDCYYPFGLTFNSWQRVGNQDNRWKYNSKELITNLDLGWYDYGARMFMPELGRWGIIDPKADKFHEWSPYNYVFNNPVNLVDPDGEQPQQGGNHQEGKENQPEQDKNNVPNLPVALQKAIKRHQTAKPVRDAFSKAIKNSNEVNNPATSEINKAISNTVNKNIRADDAGNVVITFAENGNGTDDLKKVGKKVVEEAAKELVLKGPKEVTKALDLIESLLDPVSAGQTPEDTQKQANNAFNDLLNSIISNSENNNTQDNAQPERSVTTPKEDL